MQRSAKVARQPSVNDRPRATVDGQDEIISNQPRSNNMRLVYLFLITCVLLQYATALNVLAIVSLPLKSHYMALQTLFRELAARGHSVTVMNNFPDSQPSPNLRFVDLKRKLDRNFTTLETYEDIYSSILHLRNFYHFTTYSPDIVRSDCESLFTNEYAKKHLAEGKKYDVIFVELFISECALVYAAVNYDAPIIGITSHVLLPNAYSTLGIPFDIAADSFFFSNGGPNPTLLNKVEAAALNVFYYYLNRYVFQRNIQKVFEEHTNTTLDVDFIVKDRMKMVFASQHYSMTGARLLPPQLLEISGIHISKPQAVPKDVEEFLSTAEHGAVYVSFGSNLNSNLMSQRMLNNFLSAFKKIPQKIIFKWENSTFPTGHSNVLPRKWFPQLDVLCHPKVVGFISHGGMLSSSEAVSCGKPMLVMPFFGDQFANAASLRAVGVGKTLFFADVTAENLASAIIEVTSPEMQQQAQKVSQLWHDRPLPVMESAIYWTEYVARHRSAPPPLPSKRSTWFEAWLLDVVSVLALILFIAVWLCLAICKLVKNMLCLLIGKFICRRKEKKQ